MKLSFLSADPLAVRNSCVADCDKDTEEWVQVPQLGGCTEWSLLRTIVSVSDISSDEGELLMQDDEIHHCVCATKDDFADALITSDVVHFSGHGLSEGVLGLESSQGPYLAPLSADDVTVLCSEATCLPTLVILSACHSETIGRAIAELGVPHVVAVRRKARVSDHASKVFFTTFVTSLVAGDPVKTAFDKAQRDIKDETLRPGLSRESRARQDKKFILMGSDSAHSGTVPFFVRMQHRAPVIKNRRQPYTLPFEEFPIVGRRLDQFKIVDSLVNGEARWVTASGENRIGKTKCALAACAVMAKRGSFSQFLFAQLTSIGEDAALDSFHVVRALLTANDVDFDASDIEAAFIAAASKHPRTLLILDGVDGAWAKPVRDFVRWALENIPLLRVLCTARFPLGREAEETLVTIRGLNHGDAARLFLRCLPRRINRVEVAPLGLVVDAATERQTEKLVPDEVMHIFSNPENRCGAFLQSLCGKPEDIADRAMLLRKKPLVQVVAGTIRDGTDGFLEIVETHARRCWPQSFDAIFKKDHFWQIASDRADPCRQRYISQLIATAVMEFAERLPGRSLSKFDLNFIRSKAAAWTCSEHFSAFWQWFSNCVSLLRRSNREWQSGFIFGFVTRREAASMLRACPPGTFLIRLSSRQDAFAISYTAANSQVRHSEIRCSDKGFFSPASGNELDIFPELVDLVRHFDSFDALYPTCHPKRVWSSTF